MLTEREVAAAIGSTAYGPDGSKIGTVENFFVDDRTGVPTWVSITTGLFGSRHSIAPATQASMGDGGLRLPVTADAVKAAPRLAGSHLDPTEEQALRAHYGLADAGFSDAGHADNGGTDTGRTDSGLADAAGQGTGTTFDPADLRGPQQMPAEGPVGEHVPVTDPPVAGAPPMVAAAPAAEDARPVAAAAGEGHDGDGGMVRSEEQLRVSTEHVGATRFRLVKYVVTEDVQITVPIRREEIRVEEVPLDATDTDSGEELVQHGDLAEGERPGRHTAPDEEGMPEEIVLHTERPVISVEVVPTERVRLRRELVEGIATVTGQVQREQVVVDQDAAAVSRAGQEETAGAPESR